jgi:hypothetical protein
MVVYSIPLLFGYTWNAIGPEVGPTYPSYIPHLSEIYKGRRPSSFLSIDVQTPYSYNLPYDVRVRKYILDGNLPLWNPDMALGVPFSAQGEGSPYFALQILRSLCPYIYANHITFLGIFISTIFLFLFLKEMGISETASYIGSFSYVLSGAFSAMIPVTNITSSLSVVPFLFWAIIRAVKLKTPFSYGIVSAAVALQSLSGHISTVFVILISAMLFSLYYIRLTASNLFKFIRESAIIIIYLTLGVGLSSFLLLPIFEALSLTHRSANEGLGLYFLPISHLLTFFNPLLFGQIHQGWYKINWFDLFAFAGLSVIVSVFGGISITSWGDRFQRSMFYLFIAIALFWIFRYIGFAPLNWVGLLPLFSQLSPKHANGFSVFCLCVATAIAINNIQQWKLRRFISISVMTFIVTAFTFLRIVSKTGYFNIRDGYSYILVTILLSLTTITIFIYALRLCIVSKEKARQILLFAIPAELIVYIPLGNKSLWFLHSRIGLYLVLLFAAVLFLRISVSRYKVWVAGIIVVMFAIGYAFLIYLPKNGLPNQIDLTIPPKHLLWLKERISIGERVFGIRPGLQIIPHIESIDSTGPFVSEGFGNFVKLIDGESIAFKNGDFEVSRLSYDMANYLRYKAVFDWLDVKYLVLEKQIFDKRKSEYDKLVNHKDSLNTIYEDDAAIIMESTTSLGRAYFSPSYKVYPTVSTFTKTILQFFKEHPDRIAQVTLIEKRELENSICNRLAEISPDAMSFQTPMEVVKYEPNYVRLKVNAHSAGIVVLKDAFYPGWSAFINGTKVPILRANGMVRAVEIGHPGRYKVEFRYLPKSFIWGVILCIASLSLIIGSILIDRINTKGVVKCL